MSRILLEPEHARGVAVQPLLFDGVLERQVHVFLDVESAVEPLKKFVTAGDLILLKASRSMQFERLGAALRRGSVEAD